MNKNIFLELELSLDPPIKDVGAMKEHLEKVKIPDWMKRQNDNPKYKAFVAIARSYIAEGLPQLEQQGNNARTQKHDELKRQAKTIIEIGVTERLVKNLVTDFKTFFREDTIKALVPLEKASSTIQSDDAFVQPVCPDSLKCDKRVSYAVMRKIADDLNVGTDGKIHDLYRLIGVHERTSTQEILEKSTAKDQEIRNMQPKDYKVDALGRLAGYFVFLQSDNKRKNYDVAIKSFKFEEYANITLKLYVDGWIARKKTDWKQYHVCIDNVKKLGYSQEEAEWLVYEYFCLPEAITKKCPLPEKPKAGIGWGKYENLRSHLVSLFKDGIEYHKLSNPRIKNKLQSVLEQFNDITDPDSVDSTITKIIKEDLRKFWDSCQYDGIVSNPLFRPTTLAKFPFAKLKVFLESFTR